MYTNYTCFILLMQIKNFSLTLIFSRTVYVLTFLSENIFYIFAHHKTGIFCRNEQIIKQGSCSYTLNGKCNEVRSYDVSYLHMCRNEIN